VNNPHYKAFISYSHRDEAWARWLQRSLERYRVPKRLVGKEGAFGPVPARLRPVFRDREDLSSASDLSSRIQDELARSEFLIVICSPAAAKSRWVNEEIRCFREQGGDHRVLALVVDGDPHESASDDGCFPGALLASDEGTPREPLAADVRRYADGKHLALLKVIAGLLGVRLDELRRRDAHRRFKRRLAWGTASTAMILMVGWLLYVQATTRAAAQLQRVNTEELLSYMLGDLQRLDPVTGMESLVVEESGYGPRSEILAIAGMSRDILMDRAMDWRRSGLDLAWEGERTKALQQFRDSHAALIELHRREGDTGEILFELGQAEFYVGMIHAEAGNPEKAQPHWIRYGALTRRLLNREPNNPRYVMELSYTLMNLGALEHQFPVPDVAKSLQLMQAAVQYNQMALVLEPDNPEYQESLPTQLAWMADTRLMECSLGDALELRQQIIDLRRELLAAAPESAHAKGLAYALSGLAGVQQQIGLGDEAVDSFRESVDLFSALHEAEPENEEIEWEMHYRNSRLAGVYLAMGETELAGSIIESMAARVSELEDHSNATSIYWQLEPTLFQLQRAELMLARGENEEAERTVRDSFDRLSALARDNPDVNETLDALAWASFDYWEQFGDHPDGVLELLPDNFLPGPDNVQSCSAANLAARLAVTRGEYAVARKFVDYALAKGYFEPRFIEFCKAYGLCELP
jgi:tetratricopeptide (TPR) repeat protein